MKKPRTPNFHARALREKQFRNKAVPARKKNQFPSLDEWDEDTAPLSVQPSVGSIMQLSDEPVKRKPKPIGFVQFKEAKDGKRNLR